MLQGFSGSLFFWDHIGNTFRVKSGIYLSHLSQTSLHSLLNQFMYAATCLQLVEITVNKVETSVPKRPPTLKGFLCSASAWLKVCLWYQLECYSICATFYHFFLHTQFLSSSGCGILPWRRKWPWAMQIAQPFQPC